MTLSNKPEEAVEKTKELPEPTLYFEKKSSIVWFVKFLLGTVVLLVLLIVASAVAIEYYPPREKLKAVVQE